MSIRKTSLKKNYRGAPMQQKVQLILQPQESSSYNNEANRHKR